MTTIIILVVGAVVAGAFVFMGEDEDQEVKERMAQFASLEGASEDRALESAETGPKKSEITVKLGAVAKPLTPEALAKKFEKSIERAAVPLKASEFAAFVYLAAIVPFGIGWIMWGLVFGTIAGVIGVVLPFVWLKLMFSRRLKAVSDQMLDTLILLSNAIRAGYSLLQAMDMISKESPPPMGEEFKRIIREVSFGVSVEDALLGLKERIPSEDLDLMVTVVLIQRQIGGNLSEILDKIAHTIRERIRIKGEIATLTAQGKISGAVIGLMPVALMLILYQVNPGYISLLWSFSHGWFKSWFILIGCGIMQAIGLFVILKIVDIEV